MITDGANNMSGKQNGMIAHLKKLIRDETGDPNSGVPSIWYVSNRLNLVVSAFAAVEYIKNVFKFTDWFSTRRKAVAYKKWLCEAYSKTFQEDSKAVRREVVFLQRCDWRVVDTNKTS